jgi:hypothetical protein
MSHFPAFRAVTRGAHVPGGTWLGRPLGYRCDAPLSPTLIDDSLHALKNAATPLLQNLDPDIRSAVRGDDH